MTDRSIPEPPRFLGKGFAYHPMIDRRWGRFEMVEGEDDIKQAIRIIVTTAPGERVMRPEFGCGIYDLIFEAVTAQLEADIKRVVTEALNRFEARIDVLSVTVESEKFRMGELEINVGYRVRTTNQRGNSVFPFYIPEGR